MYKHRNLNLIGVGFSISISKALELRILSRIAKVKTINGLALVQHVNVKTNFVTDIFNLAHLSKAE